MTQNNDDRDGHQPIFTLPPVVMTVIVAIITIHTAAYFALDDAGRTQLSLWFAFIPLRLSAPDLIPGGALPLVWTSITHAFLHGGWEHLIINSAWLAIFGTPIARRYGVVPFLALFGLSAIGGALAFTFFAGPQLQILVGASGGISGLTGAAMRFMFQPTEVVKDKETGEILAMGKRLASFGDLWRNSRARTFILFWVGLNGLVPLLPLFTGGMEVQIAWQAHLGGFVVGLSMVSIFETKPAPNAKT